MVRTGIMAFCLLLLAVSFVAIQGTKDAGAIGAAAVQIEFEEYMKEVDMEPTGGFQQPDGIVEFPGTVTVQVPYSPDFQSLVVYLEVSARCGEVNWQATINESLIFSNEVTSQPFLAVVNVPSDAPSQPSGEVTVSGHYRYSPGTIGGSVESVTVVITVIPYYDHSLEAIDGSEEAYRDDEVVYDITVSNEGNAHDTYRLFVDNGNDLNRKGVIVTIDDVHIPPFSDIGVKVIVSTTSSAVRGLHDIELLSRAENASLAGDPDVEGRLTLSLRILSGDRPSDGPEPQPEPQPGPDVPDGDDDGGDEGEPNGDKDIHTSGDADDSVPLLVPVFIVLLVLLIVGGTVAYLFGRTKAR